MQAQPADPKLQSQPATIPAISKSTELPLQGQPAFTALVVAFLVVIPEGGSAVAFASATHRFQPFANFPKTKRTPPPERDKLVHYGSPFITLAPDAAANGAGYTDETGAKQNETTGFGDRGDGKGDGLIVGMLSIRNENVRVGAAGGEIAL
jgi:hypothetical protein